MLEASTQIDLYDHDNPNGWHAGIYTQQAKPSMYKRNAELRKKAANYAIKARVQPVYTLLENKYYLDWFNENVLARGARGLGYGLWKGGDQAVMDGAIVNGSARAVGWLAGAARRLETGYIYHYALVMIIGVFVLMTWFVWRDQILLLIK